MITIKDMEDIYRMIYLEHNENDEMLRDMYFNHMNEVTIKKMAKTILDTLSPEKQQLNYEDFKWVSFIV